MAALLLLKKYWYFGVIALLTFLVWDNHRSAVHFKDQYELCQQTRKTDQATFKAGLAAASDANRAAVLRVEHGWQDVVASKDKEYNAKINTANARIADYIAGMRLKPSFGPNSGDPGSSGLSSSPQPTGVTDGTREGTFLPVPENDLYICAENTVKAQTWQTFYSDVKAGQINND
jgi:hypothetical protein